MKLYGNTILITGGTSGIGLELVQQLYADNHIIVVSKTPEKLSLLSSQFPKIKTICRDLSILGNVGNLIEICRNEHPEINILINNAGVEYNYLFDRQEDIYKQMEYETNVNFTAPMMLSAGLISILQRHPQSAIVNIGSGLIYGHKKNAVIYCGTKSAMHASTFSLREQLSNTNIKVFEVAPPLTDTPMTKDNPHKKMPASKVAQEFLSQFEKDRTEINIGISKYLKFANRFFPSLTQKLIRIRNSKKIPFLP